MSFFYPDNDHRNARLVELGGDCQLFLSDAKAAYARFRQLIVQVNTKIAEVYRSAGLKPPGVTAIDILKAGGAVTSISTAETAVDVTNILVGITGTVAAVTYVAPAMTIALVDAGLMTAETGGTVLVTVLGTELTVGALAGGIIGGLIVGVVVVGVGLVIEAIEGAVLRDHLRKGISDTDEIRARLKLAADKSTALLGYLQAVMTTLDTLQQAGIPLTDAVIRNLIQKDSIPAIRALESVTRDTVISELQARDASRGSWTNEDAAGSSITLPTSQPIFINAGVPVSLKLAPVPPAGLKLASLQDPDTLAPTVGYPVLETTNARYWPFSYIDNSLAMAIIAYDKQGRLLKRWDRTGARYIWKIEEDPLTGNLAFVGQVRQKIVMTWAEIAV